MTHWGVGVAAPDELSRTAAGVGACRPVERAPVFHHGLLVPWNRDSSHNSEAGHPDWRRCSSLKYGQYFRSSRLAIRAPRSRICATNYGSRGLADGFTLIELLVSTAITLGLMATLVGLTSPAQGMFDAQPELSDMQQRLRTGVDILTKDLLMAQVPVMPYRVGRRNPDPALGIFFRPDTISLVSVPWQEEEIRSHTYYLRSDVAAGVFQLRHYDGAATDLPVVDHVVKLEFAYFGADQMRLAPSELQDGPWYPDGDDANRFDADLLSIRRVRVVLRVQAARAALRGPAGVLFVRGGTAVSRERYLPDREIQFDISPRNLNLAR